LVAALIPLGTGLPAASSNSDKKDRAFGGLFQSILGDRSQPAREDSIKSDQSAEATPLTVAQKPLKKEKAADELVTATVTGNLPPVVPGSISMGPSAAGLSLNASSLNVSSLSVSSSSASSSNVSTANVSGLDGAEAGAVRLSGTFARVAANTDAVSAVELLPNGADGEIAGSSMSPPATRPGFLPVAQGEAKTGITAANPDQAELPLPATRFLPVPDFAATQDSENPAPSSDQKATPPPSSISQAAADRPDSGFLIAGLIGQTATSGVSRQLRNEITGSNPGQIAQASASATGSAAMPPNQTSPVQAASSGVLGIQASLPQPAVAAAIALPPAADSAAPTGAVFALRARTDRSSHAGSDGVRNPSRPDPGSKQADAGGSASASPVAQQATRDNSAEGIPDVHTVAPVPAFSNSNINNPNNPTDHGLSNGGSGNGPNTPAPLADPPPLPAPGVSGLQAARMVDGLAQSEMHIGLNTSSFGSVQVHTVIHDSQVGMAVGSEKGDLRNFLTAEVSGLQSSFRQQDLQLDSIRFVGAAMSANPGFSGGAGSQSGTFHQGSQGLRSQGPGSTDAFVDSAAMLDDSDARFEPWTSLSVHA
jgi:hypothetical protein